jgi:hypothetical protein
MARAMWLVAPAVLALAGQATVLAGAETKAKSEPAKAKKEIPVAPETRRKIHATFTRHAEAKFASWEEARRGVLQALLEDNLAGARRLEVEMQERGAELDAAKRAMSAELDKAGISKAVQDQEWKRWSAERVAAREAKQQTP